MNRGYNNNHVDDEQYQQEFAEGFRDAKNSRSKKRFATAGYSEGYNAYINDQPQSYRPPQTKKKPRRTRPTRRPRRNNPYYKKGYRDGNQRNSRDSQN